MTVEPPEVTMPNGKVIPIRERIMVYGGPGVGKTHQFFNIAKWHQDMGSDAKFFGLSTDGSWPAVYTNPEFSDLANIDWADVNTFQDFLDHGRKFVNTMRPQDWLSVDLSTTMWQYAQDEYARSKARQEGNKNIADLGDVWGISDTPDDYPITGWEWGMPNARYRAFSNGVLLRCPGHLYLCYGATEVKQPSRDGKGGDSAETREIFDRIGLRPDGNKHDPFTWRTILYLKKRGHHKAAIATAKEHWGYRREFGRVTAQGARLLPEDFDDFFTDYLVNTAGWKM